MRVIAGQFKGYPLMAPKSQKTRPTTDVVKEAIFCKLAFDVQDAFVLDLFAGSGALGIEALSRGAQYVDFVDNNINAVTLVKKNLSKMYGQPSTNFNVFKCDCRNFLNKTDKTYDIIFLDPPYEAGLYECCLQIIYDRKLLNPDGVVVCEHLSDFKLKAFQDKVADRKKYGNTSVSYLNF